MLKACISASLSIHKRLIDLRLFSIREEVAHLPLAIEVHRQDRSARLRIWNMEHVPMFLEPSIYCKGMRAREDLSVKSTDTRAPH